MEETERLFLVIPLEDDARATLFWELKSALGETEIPGRTTAPENWHLTLAFIGETTKADTEKLILELARAELGGPFALKLDQLGVFPEPGGARVFWVGASEESATAQALSMRAREALRRAGIGFDEKPFVAHLTLSRLKETESVARLLDRRVQVELEVERIVLYSSQAAKGKGGPPRYVEIAAFPLKQS